MTKALTPDARRLLVTYGRNIAVLCSARRLTTAQVIRRLGCSRSAFDRVRSGRARFIDPGLLQDLCAEFECSYDDLLAQQPGIYYPDPEDGDADD